MDILASGFFTFYMVFSCVSTTAGITYCIYRTVQQTREEIKKGRRAALVGE